MSQIDLGAFFRPRNVALIGASDKSSWSAMIHNRFAKFGHEGKLFAVNRSARPAHGLPAFTSCQDIPEPIDMAYIYVPVPGVIGALEDAAAAGIPNAVILTSGFAEAGGDGIALQDEVKATAERLGIGFMGPNSMGFANIAHRSAVTSINTRLPVRSGKLALVSQSGAVANEVGKFAHSQGIGLSFTAATGNEAGITVTDICDYLVDDEQVGAIALYVESLKHPDLFVAVAQRALAARKPIVLLKLGRSPLAGAIAQAHTGSLMGDDGVFDAMCRQYGVTRVASIEELVLTADLLGKVGQISPPQIGMASISGGACAMYADLAEQHGLDVVPYAQVTQDKLRDVLPSFAATLNPLDVTGVLIQEPERWTKVIPILAEDPGMGLIAAFSVLPNTPVEIEILGDSIRAIAEGFRAAGNAPVIGGMSLQSVSEEQIAFRQSAGIENVLPSLDFGVRTLRHLQDWSQRCAQPMAAPVKPAAAQSEHPVGERETLDYLRTRGVPVIPATLASDAATVQRAVEEIGGPAALKIASPDITHKTEVGGVRLNVAAQDAAEVFDQIVADATKNLPSAYIEGVLVSPMRPASTELIVGVVRDAEWGLAMSVGIGGVLTEVIKDNVIQLLPVDKTDAQGMLNSLRGAELLRGYRGQRPANLGALAEAIVAIANAAASLGPQLAALEVNPLRVDGAQVEALDALTVWRN